MTVSNMDYFPLVTGSRITREKLSSWDWRQSGTISPVTIKKTKTQDPSPARDISAIHGELLTSSCKSGRCKRNGSTTQSVSVGWPNDASGEIVG